MTLGDNGKVMVRIGMNEFQKKTTNGAVPYTAEEIAQDAIRCGKSGGTIAHFHSRLNDGRPHLGGHGRRRLLRASAGQRHGRGA